MLAHENGRGFTKFKWRNTPSHPVGGRGAASDGCSRKRCIIRGASLHM